VDRRELTRLQAVVARRMVQSKTEAPEFLLTVDADMTDAVRLRGEVKALAAEGDVVPSLNDFVVRAAGLALARHPEANAAFVDGAVERYARANVGVAVAGEGTLLVPTVFDADRKSLSAIAADTRRLALAARDGAVTPADLGAGTFTVSNLGMFGIQQFTAVLNPPQAAILAVGQLEVRPVWDGDAFVPRSRMTMTLSCDHRALYGADAARFLGSIRSLLEQPLRLVL
ncbi:MAG: 2-oxo acid dehydrogenase subunit, partial [Conexibacter sp.]|nr:2-oxo acid dehydrogenase subunit [Conexibacter sp.]